MKKYLLILCFALFTCTQYTQAQTQDSTKKKEMERFTWEIAYNTLPLLSWRNGSGLQYGLLVRKNVEKYAKGQLVLKNRAYRLMANMSFFSENPDKQRYSYQGTNYVYYVNKRMNANFNLEVGYEYQHVFNHWQFYYGCDLLYFMSYSTETTYNHTSDPIDETNTFLSHSFGVKPFLGFKYFISPRVSISTETALYNYVKFSNLKYERNTMNGLIGKDEVNILGINSYINYLNSIYFSFYF
jgi:hypothetical protein